MTDKRTTAGLAVGIDIGTTSVKAVAADENGEIVARVRVPHELRSPAPGLLEHDAAAAWVDGPRRALEQLDVQPIAVAVDAMVPSMCAVEPDGRPVTPGLLYGDERGTPTDVAAPPGQSGEAVGFLRWTVEQAPDAHGYWPAQAVANHALGGEAVMDFASAVSQAPLFGAEGWDADQLAEVGASVEQLPRVGGLGDAVGEVRALGDVAGGAVLASGLVDAMGEQLVAGATEEGDAFVMCGTTMLTWALIPEYRQVDRLWTLPHLTVPGKFLVGGPSNAGGLFLNWARRLVPDAGPAPEDPSAVPVWAPYPRGERTPLHDPDRRASLHDLDMTHGPGAVMQAAYEAAGFVVRHHLDLGGADIRRLVATGGGTKDERWMQALADCTGLPVEVAAVPDGAALGAAFVARMAAGLESELADANRWARFSHRVEPRRNWHEAADRRYARFRELAGV